jgi:DNA-binding XRE family transcriptional regulator
MGESWAVSGGIREFGAPRLVRGRPRSFAEWATLRRWGKLPPWEVDIPGFLLRLARETAGMKQTELAERIGITQQAVSQAERWTSNSTVNLMRRWFGACGYRLELTLHRGEADLLPRPARRTTSALRRQFRPVER